MIEQVLDALRDLGSNDMAALGIGPLAVVLLVSLASSFFVAYLYQVFYRTRATGSQVYRAFPLMGISITAIFISVQFSLPLSLGLLGALSIVRFRTPVKEPEEIGFILLVIAASLSAATFNLTFLGVLLAVAVVALLALRAPLPLLSARLADGMLMVALPEADGHQLESLLTLLSSQLPRGAVDSVSEGEHGITISYRFRQIDRDRVPKLYESIKGISQQARPSVFFHETGDV